MSPMPTSRRQNERNGPPHPKHSSHENVVNVNPILSELVHKYKSFSTACPSASFCQLALPRRSYHTDSFFDSK